MKRLTVVLNPDFGDPDPIVSTVRSATIEAGGVLLIHEVDGDVECVRMLAPGTWAAASAEEVKP